MSDTVQIVGFGSLLSEEDARRTCPNLSNFRCATVYGHRRVFNKVDANLAGLDDGPHVANWCLVPSHTDHTLVTVFEVPAKEWPDLLLREFDYDLKEVEFVEKATEAVGHGVSCFAHPNEKSCEAACKTEPRRYERLIQHRQKYPGALFRKDILPWPRYLAVCLNAARVQGDDYVANILDHAYLADEETNLRNYLKESFSFDN